MSTPLPPIYRDIRRLLVHTEEMVRRFSRYHKYTVGTDLREQAMRLTRGVNRSCFDTAQQVQHNFLMFKSNNQPYQEVIK